MFGQLHDAGVGVQMQHGGVHGVDQVAVIGVPDEQYGEEIMAVIVPSEGARLDGDEIIAWSRERLGSHKYPRRVEIVGAVDGSDGLTQEAIRRVRRD